jgi:FkbM family methyltransferase
MNNLFRIISILLILIIFMIIPNIFYKNYELFISDEIDKNKYYDENGNLINHKINEREEQEQAFKYIEPNDIVLELGGRYGTVSGVINYKLINKTNHIVVEPDEKIIPALTKNKELNNSKYQIFPKIISNTNKKKIDDGYGTHYIDNDSTENNTNNIISYAEFKKIYPLEFNVIVADCEGCLGEFIKNMGDDFNKINKVIFEADYPKLCNYNEIIKNLKSNGFTMVENNDNFRYVFIKY